MKKKVNGISGVLTQSPLELITGIAKHDFSLGSVWYDRKNHTTVAVDAHLAYFIIMRNIRYSYYYTMATLYDGTLTPITEDR